MKNLIIIGARGFGREVYNLSIQTKEFNNQYIVKGFLDDNSESLSNFSGYPNIICSTEDYIVHENDVFVCALGDVNQKKKYVDIIVNKGGEFINLIHPLSVICMNIKIGVGNLIFPFTYISNDVTIGNFVTIQSHAAIGHDSKLGNYIQINSQVFLGGFVQVEDLVTLHPGSMILPKKKIHSNSIIGLNTGVLKNVDKGSSVYGNPAKVIFQQNT